MRFGRLVVIDRAEDYVTPGDGRHRPRWNCLCDCGNMITTRATCLKSGCTQSCGCWLRDKTKATATKHGGFGTRLYAVWNSMRQRCNNPKNHAYGDYGGRGIKICKEWDDFAVFKEWAVGAGYDEDAPNGDCTLDRIDVDGDYSPSNCRFVSRTVQNRNKRSSIYVEHNGETRSLVEWAEKFNLCYESLWKQYKEGRLVLP